MSFSMYQASVPAYGQMLKTLTHILKKAEEHCEAKKIDPSVLVNARLYPDMAPLSRQIQIATDQVKGGLSRLAGIKKEQIDGSEDRDVKLKVGPNEMTFKGAQFLVNFSLPNYYFHVTTAYDILRHNGVEIGKRDYMGNL